jgi:hypothetical protein
MIDGSRALSEERDRLGCRVRAVAADLEFRPFSRRCPDAMGLGRACFVLRWPFLPQVRSTATAAIAPPGGRRVLSRISLRDKLPGNPAQDCANRSPGLLGDGLRHAQQLEVILVPNPRIPFTFQEKNDACRR